MRLHQLDEAGRVINLYCVGVKRPGGGWQFLDASESAGILALKVGEKFGSFLRVPDNHIDAKPYDHKASLSSTAKKENPVSSTAKKENPVSAAASKESPDA